ncbi:MAG: VanZ family protein [Betaproteobacteria bacterium]|nr:VanZ family protein [Betaproteobacteria bacterium]
MAPNATSAAARSPLPLYLAAAYTLLVIYASLHPFSGWRISGAPLTAFLTAPWPRYWTAFDLFTNVLAYLPLGFIWVPALLPQRRLWWAAALATLLGVCLSLSLETLQNFLPSRVSSNLDLGCNSLGALLGALCGARWGALLLDGGRLHALILRQIGGGAMSDAGLVLLGLWLLTQLNPEILLFGNGDLRDLLNALGLQTPLPYMAERFHWVEAAITATNTLALGLLAGCLLRTGKYVLPAALIATALLVKSFSLMLLMSTAGLSWATPGSLTGLAAGVLLWLMTARLPWRVRQALAALSLLLATALVNLAPENPYLADIIKVWRQGHFLNFNGLTRLTSSLWPFLALPWLMLLREDRTEYPLEHKIA